MASPQEIQRAGQFDIEIATLYTSTGLAQDIRPNLVNITLYESMEFNSISGEMTLHTQFGLTNVGPIIGQEFLALKFSTPTLDDEKSQMDWSENTFHVRGIFDRQNVGTKSELINVKFVSGELMRNIRTKVSEALQGPISQIVSQMLDRVNCKKDRYIEPTNGQIKYVAPNVDPYEVVDALLPRAISSDASTSAASPVYYFWESTKGMHFRTLDSCIAQLPRWTYKTVNSASNQGQKDVKRELENLQGWILGANDSMMDQSTGVMNSQLITHNTHTKSFTVKNYNYLDNFKNETHIGDGYPLYSLTPVSVADNGNERITDGKSKVFLNTTVEDNIIGNDPSHQDHAGVNSYRGNNPNAWQQRRQSQTMQLEEGIHCKINVWGNAVVSSGDIIKVDVPFYAYHSIEDKKFDDFIQGDFLVRSIRHEFDFVGRNHHMEMSIVKDTIPVLHDAIESSIEPRPKRKGLEVTTLYEIEDV